MVPDQLGGAGRPVCTIPGDGVTGLGNAVMQIESGVAEVVVLEAHSKASDVLDKEAVEDLAQEPSLMRPLGWEATRSPRWRWGRSSRGRALASRTATW